MCELHGCTGRTRRFRQGTYGKTVDMQTRVQLCTMRSRHYLTAICIVSYCAIIIMYNVQGTRHHWSNNCYYYYYIRWAVLERGSLPTAAGCIATIGMLWTNPSPLLTHVREVGAPCTLSYRLQIIATVFCNWFATFCNTNSEICDFARSPENSIFRCRGANNFADSTAESVSSRKNK